MASQNTNRSTVDFCHFLGSEKYNSCRTVSFLTVCMTGCRGLRGGSPQCMLCPSLCCDPHLSFSQSFFLMSPNSVIWHFSHLSPMIQLKNKPTRALLCCLQHLLPSWHPLFAISYKPRVWQHAYLYTCKLACTFLQARTQVLRCKSELKHFFFFFAHFIVSGEIRQTE